MFLVVFQRSSVYFQKAIFTSHLDMLYKLFSDDSVYTSHTHRTFKFTIVQIYKDTLEAFMLHQGHRFYIYVIYVKIVALLSDPFTLFHHFLFLSVSNLT